MRAIEGTKARIVDTRKTLPGLRIAQKYAVRAGGGTNHRIGLYDGILIKENHIAAAGGIKGAVELALRTAPEGTMVQVEVETLEQLSTLRELGCEAAQGYLFSEPIPSAKAEALIQAGRPV